MSFCRSAVDGNPLSGCTHVRGHTTVDSFSLQCTAASLSFETYSFVMAFDIAPLCRFLEGVLNKCSATLHYIMNYGNKAQNKRLSLVYLQSESSFVCSSLLASVDIRFVDIVKGKQWDLKRNECRLLRATT